MQTTEVDHQNMDTLAPVSVQTRLESSGEASFFWRYWSGAGSGNPRCADCDAALVLDGLKGGTQARCGSCGGVFQVPGAEPGASTSTQSLSPPPIGRIDESSARTLVSPLPSSGQGSSQSDREDTRRDSNRPLALLRKIPKSIAAYELEEEIARGGMAVVYRGRHVKLAKPVAIKLLLPTLEQSHELERRLEREALALARFRHPHIVPVLDAGSTEEGVQYLVMELIEGEDLASRIRREGPLPWKTALEFLAQVVDGIDFAHAHGVIHRDLKPGNVLLEEVDQKVQAKIVDFGLARDETTGSSLTQSGTALGTPAYMPPEQARGERSKIDRRSDLYSIGAILYEMLTGHPPFQGDSPMQVLYQVLQDDPTPLRNISPNIPKEVEAICHKAMEKEPEQRYLSAFQMLQDIRICLEGGVPPVAMNRSRSGMRGWIRKKRLAGWRGVGVGLVILLGLAWMMGQAKKARQAEHRTNEIVRLLKEGGEQTAKGDLDKAEVLFQEVQKLDVGNKEALSGREEVQRLRRIKQRAEWKRELAEGLVKVGPQELKEKLQGGTEKVSLWLDGLFSGLNPLPSQSDEVEVREDKSSPSPSPSPSSSPDLVPDPKTVGQEASAGDLVKTSVELLSDPPGRRLSIQNPANNEILFSGVTPVKTGLMPGVYLIRFEGKGGRRDMILPVYDGKAVRRVFREDGERR